VIFSSGSTGRPKPTVWTWQALLNAPIGAASRTRRAIVIQYPLNCFAGVQALIYALRNGCGIYFNSGPNWLAQLEAHRNDDPVCILATPSFWRAWLFGREGRVRCNPPLELIALGGEPADQGLLTRLTLIFPNVRLAHTYASTEFGSLFAVIDGAEGFPASLLERPLASGAKIKIDAGELFVERDGGWRATGDLVEIRGDRVIFAGRKSELVNVAGWTVSLPLIEAALHAVPGVVGMKATSRPNAIAGHVIVLEVKLAPSMDAEVVREALLQQARIRLAPHERPRAICFVDELRLTHSGKALRRSVDPKSERDCEPA
jgi:acyl-CoA synthetase (AMP-forming)/AMP-acid ligase II